MTAWLTVIGIGDDGFEGLGKRARRALIDAAVVVGGERHLAMLPGCLRARREPWPKPFEIAALLARRPEPTCVLASGDPMFYGIGATLARQLPAEELRVLPAPSSVSLAAARTQSSATRFSVATVPAGQAWASASMRRSAGPPRCSNTLSRVAP